MLVDFLMPHVNMKLDWTLKRFAFPLLLVPVVFRLEAVDINFLNDPSLTDEARINRLKDIEIRELDERQLDVLIAFSKNCQPKVAMCTFKVLQKHDEVEALSWRFLKARMSGYRETAENLDGYMNALKSLYMPEEPEMLDNPLNIYNKLSLKLPDVLELATPYNRALLVSNSEAVNALLISGKVENVFVLLPAMVGHKWQDGDALDRMMFQTLCNRILHFQNMEYPLPEEVFQRLEAVSENITDKVLAELILKIVDKYKKKGSSAESVGEKR